MGEDELLTLPEHKVLIDFVISAGGVWGERETFSSVSTPNSKTPNTGFSPIFIFFQIREKSTLVTI